MYACTHICLKIQYSRGRWRWMGTREKFFSEGIPAPAHRSISRWRVRYNHAIHHDWTRVSILCPRGWRPLLIYICRGGQHSSKQGGHNICWIFAQELGTFVLSAALSFWLLLSLFAGLCVHKHTHTHRFGRVGKSIVAFCTHMCIFLNVCISQFPIHRPSHDVYPTFFFSTWIRRASPRGTYRCYFRWIHWWLAQRGCIG
jgi:hypothetical protein